MGGLHAPANAEFSSQIFESRLVPSLWLNVDARWRGAGSHLWGTEICDEGCAAYVMAELYSADDLHTPLPGFERQHCVFFNVDELRLRLRWKGAAQVSSVVKAVVVRLFFRDATVYALGAGV